MVAPLMAQPSEGGLTPYDLRGLALDQVCSCLASADPAVRTALFCRLAPSPCPASHASGPTPTSSFSAGLAASTPAAAVAFHGAGDGGGSGGGSVGVPSSLGDDVLERGRELGCLTTSGVLELLRWCTPRVFSLQGVSPTVTDSLLLRYPAESCAMLEEVWLGWCPHLAEVEALLLKIRRAGVDGQEDEACALRCLDVSGNDGLSDGILKALAGRCPALSTLKLDSCPAVTGAFLTRLAEGCPSLAELSADGCTGLTDAGVSTFIMESEATASGVLRSLRLGGCAVGSLTAQALLMRGGCLRELNLDGCSGFGDAAVRMLCRACPGLVDLSLLGCSALTCRGAWHCTQHPAVETLAITLTLLPGPGPIIPPEVQKARRRGGGGGEAAWERGAGVQRDGNSGSRDKSRREPNPTAGLGSGGGGTRGGEHGTEQWACARCTLLNAERRSTCQACRTPRDVDTPSPPNSTASSPRSPQPSPRSSTSPSGRRRRRRGRGRAASSSRSRSPTRKNEAPECVPLPLPAVPPSGPLRRLKLELAAALPGAVAAAAAAEAEAEAGASGGNHASDPPREPPGTAGFAFPLRRFAPLLPPGLVVLDLWSSNAPSVPCWMQRQGQQQGQGHGGTEQPSRATASGCGNGGGGGGAGGRRGYGRGGGNRSWAMSSAGDDGEEAPAFEGAGSKGGGKGGQRPGGGAGSGGASFDGSAAQDGANGVLVLAGPGDLSSLSQACPSLRELVISGDPDQAANLVTSAVRIRGRGADAHKTTAAAGVHATAAAVAYFFRNRRGPKGAAADQPPSSSLRVLGIFDCPSLPPLAVLEAVAIDGGAGLESLALGFSKPLPPPSPATGSSGGSGSGKAREERGRGGGAAFGAMERQRAGRDGGGGKGMGGGGGGRGGSGEGGEMFAGGVALASETLRGLHVSGEAALTALALRCPRLERVELVSCPLLEGVEVVATPSLTEAWFENCRIGDRALESLMKACWRLETLVVSGNSSVGDPVVMSALAECPRLKTLKASGCREVGGSSFLLPFLLRRPAARTVTASLSLSPRLQLLRLEELTVSNAPGLTGAHVSALAEALPFLRHLSVSHCRALVEVAAFSGRRGDGVTGVIAGGGEEVREVCDGVRALVLAESEDPGEGDGEDDEERQSGQGRSTAAAEGGDVTDNDGEDTEEEGEQEVEAGTLGDPEEAFPRRDATAAAADDGADDDDDDDDDDDPDGYGETMAAPSSEGVGKKGRRKGGGKGRRAKNRGVGDEKEQQHERGQQNDGLGPVNDCGGRRRRKSSVGSAGDGEPEDADADGQGGGDGDRSADGRDGVNGGKSSRRKGGTGGGKRGDKVSRKEARVAARKKALTQEDGGGGGEIAGGKGKGKRGGGRRGQDDDLEDEDLGDEGEDVCQGLEFRVDGKTRVKLERLAAALPREPGRKRAGRPSCIRFLQDKCPRSAAECVWAHLPMHPPKTLKFKPLVTHAQEPSSTATSSAKRSDSRVYPPPPPPPPAAAAATVSSRSRSPRRPRSSDVGDGGTSAGSSATGVKRGEGAWGRPRLGSGAGGRGAGGESGEGVDAEVCFKSLQFLEIHSCPSLKRLEGLKCPALAVARVTGCRELASLKLEEASVLSHLDLTGCVRLEPWELPAADSNMTELRVVVLNYCRALQPKFLALLVDHARQLRRLEIYGAAVVAGPHSHAGGSSKTKKDWSTGKRDLSRAEYNRLVTKAAAITKGLDKGRPELKIVRTKKEFMREQDVAA